MNLQSFQTHLQQSFPYVSKKHTRLLLAISGGMDSVVLTDLFAKAGFDFIIAHCNFQLRGEESMRDEIFVKNLGERYNKPFFLQHFDTEKIAEEAKTSIEETARNLRYNWFLALLNDEHIFPLHCEKAVRQPDDLIQNKFIVTAHHANDSIETLLMNFFRGTGISGLHGIPARNGAIIRPLLFAKRAEIKMYANENHLQWIEDSSNQSEKYTRNFFRLNFLPSIEKYFPQTQDNLLHNIERFKEAEVLYRQAVVANKKKLLKPQGNEFLIPVLLLEKSAARQTLLWEILKDFSFSHAQMPEVLKLLRTETGTYIDAATHRIFKNRNHLIITPLAEKTSRQILIEQRDQVISFQGGSLKISLAEENIAMDKSPAVALLDAKDIAFPLLLRKWKTGDYFYPLGMQKKKKLSRFFIDQKLSLSQKENVWVVESNRRIVWIVGMRIDDRFKISDTTKRILKLSYSKTNV